MRTWKGLSWNWKPFVAACIIAIFINIFASAAAGTKPAKNIVWTTMWIYLSIEAWKYWRWKALLPYPLFLLVYVMTGFVLVDVGAYRSLTHVIVLGVLNLGGLATFYIFLTKAYRDATIVSGVTAAGLKYKGSISETLKNQNRFNDIQLPNLYAPRKVTPPNLATDKQDKAELEKSTNRYVSEVKGPSIGYLQDVSLSGSLPKLEVKSMDKSLSSDEAFYERAFNEMESADRKIGLWAKVYAEAQGNETLAKANYLKIRSGQFANEHKQALLEMESIGTFTSPTLGAKFALIPAGMFMMGSYASEEGRSDKETQHQVTISKPFYLQTTPVTQGQWKRVMGNNPAHFNHLRIEADDYPVEQVSWNDVQEFIRKLNQMEGRDGCRYRLPTEAEWEYVCRAGNTSTYCFGGDPNCLSEYAWYSDNSGEKTRPVGQKKPNPWGVYDMHGNVWEWVQDWDGDYPSGSVIDPTGPSEGLDRVNRGGSWRSIAQFCRSANREDNTPDLRLSTLGFRLLRTP